jgi:hypothetical protein
LKKKEVLMIVTRKKPILPALLAALALVPALPPPARADVDCFQKCVNCVEAASDLKGVPRRSWAGLRCADDLFACLQYRLV